MFFHTSEEKQAAQVFGVTDSLGVTLINRSHPFPLLVEEEERVHGALLANTTHGALFRTFGCMSDVPNIPFAIRFGERGGPGLPSALVLLNTLRFLLDQIALDTVQTHEGFAKHLAYAFQFQRVMADQRSALDERLAKDRKAYRVLDALCRRFVHPAQERAHDLASYLGYFAAKAVLNTGDLSKLLAIVDREELWLRLQEGRFASTLEARADVAMLTLEDFISGRLSPTELARASTASGTQLFGVIADRLCASGFETLEIKEPIWLISQTALLGKRIELLAEGVFCSEMAPFLGWSYEGERQVEIDNRNLTTSGDIQVYDVYSTWRAVLSSDPALRVFYPPNVGETGWTVGEADVLDASGWDKLAIYVTPAFEETREPAWRPGPNGVATLRVHLFCFGLTPDGSRSVAVPYVDWWQEQDRFAEFPADSLVIVALEPFLPGPTISLAPVDELVDLLGKHAPVVYWNMVANPEALTDEDAAVYDPAGDERDGGSSDRGPCAVIGRRDSHATLTCVPKYVVTTVRVATGYFSGHDGLSARAARTLGPLDDREAWGRGAKLAYDLMYAHEILPGALPACSGFDLFRFLSGDVPERDGA